MSLIEALPTFSKSATLEQFRASFDAVQCVWFKQVNNDDSYIKNVENAPNVNETNDTTIRRMKSSATGSSSTDSDRLNTTEVVKKRKRGQSIISPLTAIETAGIESDCKFIPSTATSTSTSTSTSTATDSHCTKAITYQSLILTTIQSSTPKDQKSWSIENSNNSPKTNNNTVTTPTPSTNKITTPSSFLSPTSHQTGYCSFVLQDDSHNAVTNFTNHHHHSHHNVRHHPTLPLTTTTTSQKQELESTVSIAPPYWLFVGRNNTNQPLRGRNEHTDDIQHNGGTYHHQVVGRKTWRIRPTEELREMCDGMDLALKGEYVAEVEEGDLFVINTRLWWHRTEIPGWGEVGTKEVGERVVDRGDNVSISYARDIYLDGTQPAKDEDEMHMFSKDGAWATAFLPKGTVLLTEVDPPIGRTSVRADANCELVVVGVHDDDDSDEEDSVGGKPRQLALFTTKDIEEGGFFTMLESDDDDEGGGGEEGSYS